MKLTIERERLLKPLSYVASVVEKRQTLPILGNVFLQQNNNSLTLVGTDLETEVATRIDNVTGEDGECTVTARKFYDICRALPEEAEIEINYQGDRTLIRSQTARFTLQSLPAADFPRVEAHQWEVNFAVGASALQQLLDRTAFAMAQQDVRYYLNGCLLELEGKTLRSVATDGHRLAKSELVVDQDLGAKRQAIIPRKAVTELTRFLVDSGEEASVGLNPNHVRVEVGTLVFTSKLIDGRFPDYDRVVPADTDIHLSVDRTSFHDVLARTAILTNEKFRGVKLSLKPGVMGVMAHNPDQEEASDEIGIDYQGQELEVGFNVSYVMDALRALETDNVDFGLQDPNSSCVLKSPGDSTTVYIVMPMRL